MTVQSPADVIDDPDLPDPMPDPEPEPGGPIPETGSPPQRAPGADGPPLRMPRDNPDVETEV
jgi:hypothetical protein